MKNPFYRFKAGKSGHAATININHMTSYAMGSDGLLRIWLSDSPHSVTIVDFSVEDMDFLLARHFQQNDVYDKVKDAEDAIKI